MSVTAICLLLPKFIDNISTIYGLKPTSLIASHLFEISKIYNY